MNETTPPPRVTIIIPSWTGEVGQVMSSIVRQTFQDYDVDVVTGVSPAARARNLGARRARGEYLLFIDDDAYFGGDRMLEALVALLDRDPQIAVVGTSKLIPENANTFQRAVARQVPRMVYPVVAHDTESNPPLRRYGFTAVTTTCCLVRRRVFEEVGGFDEELTTGPEDTDFFYRGHRRGYRIVVAGNCWVHHAPPASLRDLLRKSFWYGLGHALEARKTPERGMAVLPLDRWYGKVALVSALLGFPVALFVHPYFDPTRRVEFGFWPLKTLSTYAVLCGYAYGWAWGKPRRLVTTYGGRKAGRGTADRPATVLYVDAFPQIGGGQRVLLAIATRLTPERYQPLVGLSPQSPLHARLAALDVRSVAIPFTPYTYTLPNPRNLFTILRTAVDVARVLVRVAWVARREQVDLIHANSVVAGVLVLPVANWLQAPCVVHSHDFMAAPFTDRFLRLLLRNSRQVAMIFVSRALADYYGAGQDAAYHYRIIPNGVDLAAFHADAEARTAFLRECGLPPDCFVIGAVGRIERNKGFNVLLDAFALIAERYPRARLVIVGDVLFEHPRDVKQELIRQARTLGVADRVVFTGFRDDIPTVMAGLDVLVHCPLEREGFGLILIEAMACGRPVIAAALGGMAEVAFAGENGLLVPPGDPEAIAAALARLLDDPALARRLGAAGQRIVRERFSVERQAAAVECLYDWLLGQKTPVSGEGDAQRASGVT